jgi:hypothetical protein
MSNGNLFLMILDTEKSKIKVPASDRAFYYFVLEIKPRASCMLGKHSTTELYL